VDKIAIKITPNQIFMKPEFRQIKKIDNREATKMGSLTLIGLGAMGSALAKVLVADGHNTTVWN
jgi:hypothetical protein